MTGDAGPGILTSGRYDAALFDMDGVVTDTASIHASCWKTMFDDFLRKRAAGGAFRPFDINTDYGVYVDGKPRYEGVRDFLTSRDIALPEGTRDSPPTEESICGLGNRKNELVNERFAASGVTAYPGTVALLRMLRPAGIKTALVTSSQNAHLVLRAAKLEAMFDALVDGDVPRRQQPSRQASARLLSEGGRNARRAAVARGGDRGCDLRCAGRRCRRVRSGDRGRAEARRRCAQDQRRHHGCRGSGGDHSIRL